MENIFLLQHGVYGEGPMNPYLVSDSSLKLLQKVREDHGNKIDRINSIFDSGCCIQICLKEYVEYDGMKYNMFFIDKINVL